MRLKSVIDPLAEPIVWERKFFGLSSILLIKLQIKLII